MSDTSIWVPISSAVAALFGAGFGAMLQGRYGVSGWRRQIRLEAYAGFVNAAHDFNNRLGEVLDTVEESNYEEKRKELREAELRLGRAGSLASIAGPQVIDNAAKTVINDTRSIMKDAKDREAFLAIALARKKGESYKKRSAWIKSAGSFEDTSRRVLRTQGS